jgi:predicted nucleic acid-binding protein
MERPPAGQSRRPADNYRKKPSLSFSDCLVLEVARKVGHLPLGTFDRGLTKLDGTHRL